MGYSVASLLARLPSPYSTAAGSNNEKLAQAIRDGHWEAFEADLQTIFSNLHLVDMTDFGFLRAWQSGWLNVQEKPNETFSSYKLRVQGALTRRVSEGHPEEILAAVASLIRATTADVTLVENEDPTDASYRHGYFYVSFSQDTLASAGFDPSEFADVIAEVELVINQMAPAGVLGEVVTEGGAEWDSGIWDTDLWGF